MIGHRLVCAGRRVPNKTKMPDASSGCNDILILWAGNTGISNVHHDDSTTHPAMAQGGTAVVQVRISQPRGFRYFGLDLAGPPYAS